MDEVEFYSHIHEADATGISGRKTLKQHLQEVLGFANRSVDQLPPYFSQSNGFRNLVTLSCLCHDFGKFTSYFQEYLLENKRQGSRHHHGFISSVFAAFQVSSASPQIWPEIDPYLPMLSYLCVLHHHGHLGNLQNDVIRKSKLEPAGRNELDPGHLTSLRNAEAQVADVQGAMNDIERVYKSLLKDHDFQMHKFAGEWIDALAVMDRMRYLFENRVGDESKIRAFIYLLLVYSILIDADKKSAADLVVPTQRRHLSSGLVDRYREECPKIDMWSKEGINGIRNEIYSKVLSAMEGIDLDAYHIMTLTSPTGTGKTLSALSAALKLRDRIEKEKGFSPRIIYSLPFTSIIDQNFDVVEDVLALSTEDYRDNQHEYLLKHHYLSNVEFKGEGQEREPDDAILLIESWESEIVVTTFVQLLETIIGYRNRSLKKYHKIAGSIIVLDEVQNIPVEYWPLVSDSLKLLCKMLDCYIILLTATKPLIFEEDECFELVRDNEEYFSHFRRTRLNTNMGGISLEDMAERFADLYEEDLSFMVVANTIKSSLYLYKRISESVEDGLVLGPLYYLSSNIIPRDRRRRVGEISRALENGNKPVLVSTQVVEAGVDLDFDRVIRDLGPIDSVIQVAGRCNRSGKHPTADVYVYNITDDRGRSLSTYVYGKISTNAARSALATGIYEEPIYHGLVNEFFKNVKQMESQQKSRDIWKAVANLCFHSDDETSVSDFSLIESLPNMMDVFVQVDEDTIAIWEKYRETVLGEKDIRKKQLNFMRIKADFRSYVISVPEKLATGLVQTARRFYVLPYEGLEQYYDCVTGFKRVPEETTWIL